MHRYAGRADRAQNIPTAVVELPAVYSLTTIWKKRGRGRVEDGAVITGKIGVDEGTGIRKGCSVRGPVIIGRNCEP